MSENKYDVVNIRDNENLRYWAEKFGVTTKEVRHAVGLVGPDPERVRTYVAAAGQTGEGEQSASK